MAEKNKDKEENKAKKKDKNTTSVFFNGKTYTGTTKEILQQINAAREQQGDLPSVSTQFIGRGSLTVDPTTGQVIEKGRVRRTIPMPETNLLPGVPIFPPGTQLPLYTEGQQFDLYDIATDRDAYIALQHRMMEAGYYNDSDDIIEGVVGAADVEAYYKLLWDSNANYADYETTLNNRLSNPNLRGKKVQAPLIINLTNEDDIRTVVLDSVQRLYGGGDIPEGTLQAVVDAIHNQQRTAAQIEYDMTGNQVGGEFMDPARLQSVADKILTERDPEQVYATRFGEAMEGVLSTLASSPYRRSNG